MISLSKKELGIYVILSITTILMLYIALPFLGTFIMAFIVVLVLTPLYTFILKYVKNKSLSSVLATLSIFLFIFIPTYLFFSFSINQLGSVTKFVQTSEAGDKIKNINIQKATTTLSRFVDIEQLQTSFNSGITTFLKEKVLPLGGQTVKFFINLILFLLFLVYLFPARTKIVTYIKKILPLEKEDSEFIVNRFTGATTQIMKSLFITAPTQGILAGLLFFIFNIPAAAFFTMAMIFLSFLPLGAGLITVPVALIYLLQGNYIIGITLLVWQILVVGNIDNIIRGKMFKGGSVNIPQYLTLLSTLGGVAVFGFMGVIYGPLITVAFLSILQVYLRHKN